MAVKPSFSGNVLDCIVNKQRALGIGSYGAVYEASYEELPCAAKVLHSSLIEINPTSYQKLVERFQSECEVLNKIRHPCIVQFLGIAHEPGSSLPTIVMELMDESLTKFLERSDTELPLYLQVNFSHDIALALAYLHSLDITHRDLSSNNVLLVAGTRAKVTDFGMSVFKSRSRSMLTSCPGTQAYMAPECLGEVVQYTQSIDCFSFGVLLVQIITRQFPSPSSRLNEAVVRRGLFGRQNPHETYLRVIPEVIRRQNHISLIDHRNPLKDILMPCLSDREYNRPSARDLCRSLAAIKEGNPLYAESLENSADYQLTVIKEADATRDELQSTASELIKTRSEIDDYQRQNERLQLRNRSLEQQVNELAQRVEELDIQILDAEQKQRGTQAKGGLMGFFRGDKDRGSAEQLLQEKINELRNLHSQNLSMLKKTEAIQSELEQKNQELALKNGAIHDKTQQIRNLRDKMDALEVDLSLERHRSSSANDELRRKEEELQEKVQELQQSQDQAATLEESLDTLKAITEALIESSDLAQEAIKKKDETIFERDRDIESLMRELVPKRKTRVCDKHRKSHKSPTISNEKSKKHGWRERSTPDSFYSDSESSEDCTDTVSSLRSKSSMEDDILHSSRDQNGDYEKSPASLLSQECCEDESEVLPSMTNHSIPCSPTSLSPAVPHNACYDMQSSADKENSSEDDSDDLYRPPTPKDSVDMSCDHNSSLLESSASQESLYTCDGASKPVPPSCQVYGSSLLDDAKLRVHVVSIPSRLTATRVVSSCQPSVTMSESPSSSKISTIGVHLEEDTSRESLLSVRSKPVNEECVDSLSNTTATPDVCGLQSQPDSHNEVRRTVIVSTCKSCGCKTEMAMNTPSHPESPTSCNLQVKDSKKEGVINEVDEESKVTLQNPSLHSPDQNHLLSNHQVGEGVASAEHNHRKHLESEHTSQFSTPQQQPSENLRPGQQHHSDSADVESELLLHVIQAQPPQTHQKQSLPSGELSHLSQCDKPGMSQTHTKSTSLTTGTQGRPSPDNTTTAAVAAAIAQPQEFSSHVTCQSHPVQLPALGQHQTAVHVHSEKHSVKQTRSIGVQHDHTAQESQSESEQPLLVNYEQSTPHPLSRASVLQQGKQQGGMIESNSEQEEVHHSQSQPTQMQEQQPQKPQSHYSSQSTMMQSEQHVPLHSTGVHQSSSQPPDVHSPTSLVNQSKQLEEVTQNAQYHIQSPPTQQQPAKDSSTQPHPLQLPSMQQGQTQPPSMQQGQMQPSPMQQGQMQPPSMQQGQLQMSPMQQGQTQPSPMQQGQTQPSPMQPVQMQPSLMQQGQMQLPSMQQGQIQPPSMQQGQTQPSPMQRGQMQTSPMRRGQMLPSPMQQGQVQMSPMQQSQMPPLMQHGQVQLPPMQQGQTQPSPMQQGQMQTSPMQHGQTQPSPMQQGQMQPPSMQQGQKPQKPQSHYSSQSTMMQSEQHVPLHSTGVHQSSSQPPDVHSPTSLVNQSKQLEEVTQNAQYHIQSPPTQQQPAKDSSTQPHPLQPPSMQQGQTQPPSMQQGQMQPSLMQQGQMQTSPMQQSQMQPSPMQQGQMQPPSMQQGQLQMSPMQQGQTQPSPMQQGQTQPSPMQPVQMQPSLMQQGQMQLPSMQQGQIQPPSMQQGQTQPSPMQRGQMQTSPMQQGQMQPSPMQPDQMQPSPMQQGQMQLPSMQQGQTQPSPMQRGQMQPPSMQQGQMQPSPMQQGQTQPSPMQQGQTQPSPMQQGQMQTSPMQQGQMQPSPMQQGQTQPSLMQQGQTRPSPMQQGQMQPSPMQQGQTQPSPMQQGQTRPSPMQQGQTQPSPMQQGQMQPSPMQTFPMRQGQMLPSPMQQGQVQMSPMQQSQMPPLMQQSQVQPPSMQQGQMQPSPMQQSQMQPSPMQQGQTQPSPMQQGQTRPSPMQQGQTQPSPMQQGQMQPSPMQQGQTRPSPMQQGQTQPSPMQQGQTQPSPMQQGQMQTSPLRQGQMLPSPMQQGQVQMSPMQQSQMPPLMQQGQVQLPPMQQGQMQQSPMQQGQMQTSPMQQGQTQPSPMQQGQMQPSPMQQGQTQPSPMQQGQLQPPSMQQSQEQPPSMQPSPMQQGQMQPSPMQPDQMQPSPMQQGQMQPPSMQQAQMHKPSVQQSPTQHSPVQLPAAQQLYVQHPSMQHSSMQQHSSMHQPSIQQHQTQQSSVPQGQIQQPSMHQGEIQKAQMQHHLMQQPQPHFNTQQLEKVSQRVPLSFSYRQSSLQPSQQLSQGTRHGDSQCSEMNNEQQQGNYNITKNLHSVQQTSLSAQPPANHGVQADQLQNQNKIFFNQNVSKEQEKTVKPYEVHSMMQNNVMPQEKSHFTAVYDHSSQSEEHLNPPHAAAVSSAHEQGNSWQQRPTDMPRRETHTVPQQHIQATGFTPNEVVEMNVEQYSHLPSVQHLTDKQHSMMDSQSHSRKIHFSHTPSSLPTSYQSSVDASQPLTSTPHSQAPTPTCNSEHYHGDVAHTPALPNPSLQSAHGPSTTVPDKHQEWTGEAYYIKGGNLASNRAEGYVMTETSSRHPQKSKTAPLHDYDNMQTASNATYRESTNYDDSRRSKTMHMRGTVTPSNVPHKPQYVQSMPQDNSSQRHPSAQYKNQSSVSSEESVSSTYSHGNYSSPQSNESSIDSHKNFSHTSNRPAMGRQSQASSAYGGARHNDSEMVAQQPQTLSGVQQGSERVMTTHETHTPSRTVHNEGLFPNIAAEHERAKSSGMGYYPSPNRSLPPNLNRPPPPARRHPYDRSNSSPNYPRTRSEPRDMNKRFPSMKRRRGVRRPPSTWTAPVPPVVFFPPPYYGGEPMFNYGVYGHQHLRFTQQHYPQQYYHLGDLEEDTDDFGDYDNTFDEYDDSEPDDRRRPERPHNDRTSRQFDDSCARQPVGADARRDDRYPPNTRRNSQPPPPPPHRQASSRSDSYGSSTPLDSPRQMGSRSERARQPVSADAWHDDRYPPNTRRNSQPPPLPRISSRSDSYDSSVSQDSPRQKGSRSGPEDTYSNDYISLHKDEVVQALGKSVQAEEYSVVLMQPDYVDDLNAPWTAVFAVCRRHPNCINALLEQLQKQKESNYTVTHISIVFDENEQLVLDIPKREAERQGYVISPSIDPVMIKRCEATPPHKDFGPKADSIYPPRHTLTIYPPPQTGDTRRHRLNVPLKIKGARNCVRHFVLKSPHHTSPDRVSTGLLSRSRVHTQLQSPPLEVSDVLHNEADSMTFIQLVGKKIPHRWRDLGIYLGIPQNELDMMAHRQDQDGSTCQCLVAVFEHWKNHQTDKEPNWNNLISTISKLDENLARGMTAVLCSGECF